VNTPGNASLSFTSPSGLAFTALNGLGARGILLPSEQFENGSKAAKNLRRLLFGQGPTPVVTYDARPRSRPSKSIPSASIVRAGIFKSNLKGLLMPHSSRLLVGNAAQVAAVSVFV
jgi:hypothetical protein